MNTLSREAEELRFAVYCLECKWLLAANYPTGRERDTHDATALHFEAPDAEGWAEHNAISLGPLDKIVHQRAEAILWSRIFAYLRSTKRT